MVPCTIGQELSSLSSKIEEKTPTDAYINIAESHFSSWESTGYGVKEIYDLGPLCTAIYQKHSSGKYGAILLFGYQFDRMIYVTCSDGVWGEPKYVANKPVTV